MRNRHEYNLMMLLLFISFTLFLNCTTKEKSNPLDPTNVNSTDPFQLQVIQKVESDKLEWAIIENEIVDGYNIYKSISTNDNFVKIFTTDKQTTIYYDDSVTNGVSYFYSVSAIDKKGNESIVSKTVGIDRDQPILLFQSQTIFQSQNLTNPYAQEPLLIDFNNDGLMDIIYSTQSYPYYLKIWINYGYGNFSQDVSIEFEGLIKSFAVSDLNKDNFDDIVLIHAPDSAKDSIIILWNDNGLINLENRTILRVDSTFNPIRVKTADFDGDNLEDIAIYFKEGWCPIFSNDSIPEPGNMILNSDNCCYDPTLFLGDIRNFYPIDVEGTGAADIVTIRISNLGSDNIFLTDIDPSTLHAQNLGNNNKSWYAHTAPYSFSVGDINNDNSKDFVIITHGFESSGHGINIYQNKFNGTLFDESTIIDSSWFYQIDGRPFLNDVCLLHANNDNFLDIAVISQRYSELSIWYGNGDGTFQQPINFINELWSVKLLCADFDNDGDEDIVVVQSDGTYSLFTNNTK